MTVRIDAPQPIQQALGVGGGLRDTIRGQAGQFAGLNLEVRAPTVSVLGNAAEEIALLFSEKAEHKRHEDRIVKGTTRPSDLTIEAINAYLDKAHKQSKTQELTDAARRLLAAGAEGLRQALRELQSFESPTDRYLLLRFTRLLASQEGASPEMRQSLDQAIADLETLYGDTIQAHLLTIDQAASYARSPQEVGAFQGSLMAVMDAPTLAKALQEVLGLAGNTGQRLDQAMETLMKALGTCLTGGVVQQPALLQAVLADLFQLKSLNTLLEACRRMLGLMQSTERDKQRARERGDARLSGLAGRPQREVQAGTGTDGDTASPSFGLALGAAAPRGGPHGQG